MRERDGVDRAVRRVRARSVGGDDMTSGEPASGRRGACRTGCACAQPRTDRRALLGGVLATGISLSVDGRLLAADSPAMARPREGDQFVFASGEQAGKPVGLTDLVPGPPVLAWPVEPSSKTVRDGSRLNQVLLLRLDAASLDEATRARAAEGTVAYAATCTHAQCPVTGWIEDRQVLHCYCHNSEYDPK